MIARHTPFGGEAEVFFQAVMDQIERQGKHLTVADCYAVMSFIKAEAEVQLALDVMRRVHENAEKVGAGGTAPDDYETGYQHGLRDGRDEGHNS